MVEEVAQDEVEPALEIIVLLQDDVIVTKQDPITPEYPLLRSVAEPAPIINDIQALVAGSPLGVPSGEF
jgi:hypothetical protein